MSGYANKFIEDIYHKAEVESGDKYSTITVRLEPEHATMLKAMAKGLGFSVSTAFTDILSKHLFDLVVSLNEEDFNDVTKEFLAFNKQYNVCGGSALERLLEEGLIPEAVLELDAQALSISL
ncbi:hypothetical protein [Shewanella sp.]|uniref:hypothetical protein n=1 Tax=Shewanella sp. TaxID=50422 RepID=UPI003F3BBD45